MIRQSYLGATYIDVWPSGQFAALYPSSHIQTHIGRVDLPIGETFGLLYLHCTPVGGFRFGGQRHDDGQMQEWTEVSGWQPSKPPLSARAVYVGSVLTDILPAGYQYVDETNGPIERTVTYGPKNGLSEWAMVGNLQIGQLHDGDPGLGLWDGTTLRLIEPGLCTFHNEHRDGENVTLSFCKPGEAVRIDTTMAELRARPPVLTPKPEPPSTYTIGPAGPPRPADGRLYDLLPFVVGEAQFWPRRGPSHTLGQIVRPQARGGLYYYVKFAGNEPGAANGESYEAWAWDDNWIYQLEDATAWDADTSTDFRMWPRFMQIGEQHAFQTGPHEKIWHDRTTCRETKREPWQRKMWLHEVRDWNWGPDLGVRLTGTLVYDATAGFHTPGRYIEIGLYALKAGECRWEPHKSWICYENSKTAVFSDASRADRKDFYLIGGPNPQPKLLNCVPQVVPNEPPWKPTSDPPKPPIPVEDLMLAYGPIVPGFKPGKDHDNGNGTISVQKPNGKWLCVTPDGGIEERDTPGGAWESFIKSGNSIVAERDGGARGTLVYVLAVAG